MIEFGEKNLGTGDVYLIERYDDKYIIAQVAKGDDLAIFQGLHERGVDFELVYSEAMFRINFNAVSAKRHHWINIGKQPYKKGLSDFQPYFYKPVGGSRCLLVYLDGREFSISCAEERNFEALESWSHEHILSRFDQESYLER